MDGTGLRPNTKFVNYPRPPHLDHPSEWIDPHTGKLLVVSEPYREAELDAEDKLWSEQNRWFLGVSKWPGMYYPGRCPLFIATEATDNTKIAELISKIDDLPTTYTSENWSGISAPSHETFLSPKAVTPQAKRRAKPSGMIMRLASKKTIPMASGSRRPKNSMPLELHIEVGSIILQLLSFRLSGGSRDRLNRVRSDLEDWMFAEHKIGARTDDGGDPLEIYYGSVPNRDPELDPVKLTERVKTCLLQSYNDCEPLRAMLHRLERATALA